MKFGKCHSLLSALFLISVSYAKNNNSCYNKKEILAETGWKDVSVQENAPFHLSVISQGIYNQTDSQNYDKNYYYPSSAGEGVDVYVFDTGFDFTFSEFSNVNASCDLIIDTFTVKKLNSTKICHDEHDVFDHGTMVSTAIAGEFAGVAKKANIHGVLLTMNFDETLFKNQTIIDQDFIKDFDTNVFYIGSIVAFLKYLKDNQLIKPNKTVINFSNGLNIDIADIKDTINKPIYKEAQDLFNELNKMGTVIVAGAGNIERKEGETNKKYVPVYHDGKAFYPCSFENVICAGGVGNFTIPEEDIIQNDEIDSSFYQLGHFKNYDSVYGEVDIYSPFVFHYKGVLSYDKKNGEKLELPPTNETATINNYESILPGTSFSTPIVAGVVATLMSEFPEKQFNYDSVKEYFNNHAEDLTGFIDLIPDNKNYTRLFINNGKKSSYKCTLPMDIPSDDEEDITNEVEVDDNSDNEVEEVDSADEQ